MGGVNQLAMKLAIRTDHENGVVRAFVSDIAGSYKTELGSIAIACLDGRDGPLFRRWLDVMREALAHVLKSATGIEVAEWTGDINPDDLEGKPQG